jgi:hypothetical protein
MIAELPVNVNVNVRSPTRYNYHGTEKGLGSKTGKKRSKMRDFNK